VAVDEKKIKLAKEVPDPPQLTSAVLQEIADEAREWHDAFTRQTVPMEKITADDLKVRAR
jgi:hypothetical protein